MTTTVIGINPFKAQNPRTARHFFRPFNHILQARMGGGLKFLSLGQMAGNRAEFAETAENLRDLFRDRLRWWSVQSGCNHDFSALV